MVKQDSLESKEGVVRICRNYRVWSLYSETSEEEKEKGARANVNSRIAARAARPSLLGSMKIQRDLDLRCPLQDALWN